MAECYERPFVPVDLAERSAALFPLQEMIDQLRKEESFRDSNRNARTLVSRANGLAPKKEDENDVELPSERMAVKFRSEGERPGTIVASFRF